MKSKSGYDLMLEVNAVIGELIASEGESTEAIDEFIERLGEDIDQKMKGYRHVIRTLQERADAFKAEGARCNAQASTLMKLAKRRKEQAQRLLESQCELHGWEAGRKADDGAIYLSRRKRLKVDDEQRLIARYKDSDFVQRKLSLNRAAIRAELEDGHDVAGASIEEFTILTIK